MRNKDVQFDLIDKLYSTFSETSKKVDRGALIVAVLAVVVAGLVAGAIRLEEKFTFLGLSLQMKNGAILSGLAFLLAAWGVMLVALVDRKEALHDELQRQYVSLEDTPETRRLTWLLQYPDFSVTLISDAIFSGDGWVGRVGEPLALTLVFALLSLPFIVPLFAAYELWRQLGTNVWLAPPLLGALTYIFFLVASYKQRGRKSNNETRA